MGIEQKPHGRVLVADDERSIRELVRVQLEAQGYSVVCVADGQEAIERIQAESFDKAVLDVMMPYADGIEVLRFIRSNERTKHMWVLLVTTNEEWQARDDAEVQADRYVIKPFRDGDLKF